MTADHKAASGIPHTAHGINTRGTTASAQLHRSQLHLSIVEELKETQTSKGYVISGEISPDVAVSASQSLGRHVEREQRLHCGRSYPPGFDPEL
jgi:hypothetical protein